MQFHFSNHVLDGALRELTRGGGTIAVEPQVFDLLIYLIENRDRVVSKDDLLESIWDGRIVSDSTLTSRINAARKAVGDSGKHQAVIRTHARKGFRFVGEVSANVTPQDPAAASSQPQIAHPETSRPTEATSVAQPPLDRPAIAVLPFTGEPEKDYFSEGISEDIITALSKLRWFYVIARNLSPGCEDGNDIDLAYLPAAFWLLGLGNLGQAALWTIGLLPYSDAGLVSLFLQDSDKSELGNLVIQVLTKPGWIGRKKARSAVLWAEERGFATTIIETRLVEGTKRSADEPGLALVGVDNLAARRAAAGSNFDLVLDAGRGATASEIFDIRIHRFPGGRSPAQA